MARRELVGICVSVCRTRPSNYGGKGLSKFKFPFHRNDSLPRACVSPRLGLSTLLIVRVAPGATRVCGTVLHHHLLPFANSGVQIVNDRGSRCTVSPVARGRRQWVPLLQVTPVRRPNESLVTGYQWRFIQRSLSPRCRYPDHLARRLSSRLSTCRLWPSVILR